MTGTACRYTGRSPHYGPWRFPSPVSKLGDFSGEGTGPRGICIRQCPIAYLAKPSTAVRAWVKASV